MLWNNLYEQATKPAWANKQNEKTCIKTLQEMASSHTANTAKVSRSLISLISTNMAISETKSQGWRAIPTE